MKYLINPDIVRGTNTIVVSNDDKINFVVSDTRLECDISLSHSVFLNLSMAPDTKAAKINNCKVKSDGDSINTTLLVSISYTQDPHINIYTEDACKIMSGNLTNMFFDIFIEDIIHTNFSNGRNLFIASCEKFKDINELRESIAKHKTVIEFANSSIELIKKLNAKYGFSTLWRVGRYKLKGEKYGL